MARITQVEHIGGLILRLTFDDGLVREFDFTEILEAPLFEALRDPSYFGKVTIDATSRTITWPNGIDFDPDVLHGDYPPATGPGARLTAEYHLRPTV